VVDADAFRAALGSVCTPVAVVTSCHDGRPHGTTVSAFCSVSLEPPLVLVALDRGSSLLATIRAAGAYGVNVLDHGQRDLAGRFASRRHADRFAGVAWAADAGLPRLEGSSAWLACSVHELVGSGDHVLAIGAVQAAERTGGAPLLYRERAFGTLAA
jgi:flavin reductase (DIM6/NTAB) family NADH-FMN oxidoreductase RutF